MESEPVYTVTKRLDETKGYQAYKDCFFEATLVGEVCGQKVGDKTTVENRYFDEEKIKEELYKRYNTKKDAIIMTQKEKLK